MKVRLGVIGVGGMGQIHCRYLPTLEEVELAAVCDIVPQLAKEVGERHGVPFFTEAGRLFDSGLVDAVLIATPHYHHPPIAIDAFRHGLHVLSEKPIAVTPQAASEMIRAAERSRLVFGAMLQYRTFPYHRAAKELIEQGGLGELVRTSLVLSMYRTQAYYRSAGWRATWKGEGGGVLLNQAPHGLDIFLWLAGRPCTVTGQTRTRCHQIEVEDEAFALLEYANGAHGYVYTSVNEVPQEDRMEICGDRGKLLIDGSRLRFWRIPDTLCRYTQESGEKWGCPEAVEVPLDLPAPVPENEHQHAAITRSFCRAILYQEPLLAPGSEALWSLELANAMILSNYRRKAVQLPLDGAEYEELLAELRAAPVAADAPTAGHREAGGTYDDAQ